MAEFYLSQFKKYPNHSIIEIGKKIDTADEQELGGAFYVDKNLKHHGLIQAFSRTNRILNEQKSQGNIVCFRNLKKATDDALTLFSNEDAKETVIMPPYQDFVRLFNKALDHMQAIAPDVESVDDL